MIKKTFQAAAMLAPLLCMPAPAHAQSTVSIYGVLDEAVTVSHSGSGVANKKTLDSGVGYGSRLGFKGSEDLGGGLSANFLMEMGIGADTGVLQQGGSAFGRQIYVGLAAPHWSVTAGRQYSPLWLSLIFSDAFAWTYWGNTEGTLMQSVSPTSVAGDGGFGALSRVNNSVIVSGYQGPVTGRLMVAAGDENDSGTGRLINGNLSYAANGLGVTASLARFRQYAKDIPAGAKPEWQTALEVGAHYDFKVLKLLTGYYRYDPSESNIAVKTTTTLKTSAYWLGALVPTGTFGRVFMQVMASRFDHQASVEQGRATTFGLTYEYAFSKRTFLYSSYGQVTNNTTSSLALYGGTTSVAPNAIGEDPRALSIGVRHSF